MHTHTPYATALGCLEDPSLMMVHQNSCRCDILTFIILILDNISKLLMLIFRFLRRCAWDTGYQPATMVEEGERLGQVLGDKDILFMCHHGTLVTAESVHVAFDEVKQSRKTTIKIFQPIF